MSGSMAEDTSGDGGARPRPASPTRQPSGADAGWAVTGTILSGMAVWGGVGWLLDQWLNIRVFFPVGVILGVAVAIYVVVIKFGTVEPPPARRAPGTPPGRRRSRPRGQGQTQKGQR